MSVNSDSTVTIAVGASGGHRHRRAVRWAAANLVPHSHRVLLLHVIPSTCSVPSPSGKRIPIGELEKEVVELYVNDVKLKAEEVFLPYRRMCRSKNVETMVVEGESAAEGLLRYLREAGTGNLVMGSSSWGWIRRILKGRDVPTTILESAPDFCNIFVVSRRKLTMKISNQSLIVGHSTMQIQTVSLMTFARKTSRWISSVSSEVETCSQDREDDNASVTSSVNSEASSVLSYSSQHKEGSLGKRILELQTLKKYDNITPYKDVPYIIKNSTKEIEDPEVVKLRQELSYTLGLYKRACEDLVHAKKKVEALSNECSEEAKRVKDALAREEVLQQIAAEEKAKHLEAIEEIEEARNSLAKETHDRLEAEIIARNMSAERFKVVESFFSNGKSCRRYSKSEMELATDNFSEAKKIGEGGYGKVYKCSLDHTPVAIKVLRQDARDKKEEFIREVEILSQLRHPHMVLLLGGCPESGCLVYEYMENRSLEDQLFNTQGSTLPWFIRFRILFEVACGLAFLHGSKPEPIVHRDLKPGNILLDRNYTSKIGDVGMAKLISDVIPDGQTEYNDTFLAGTFYYMDPEYQRTGTVRPKSDLYSLGIVALQLLTARHPRGLLVDVERAIDSGSFANLLDKSISNWPLLEAEKLAKLALKCARLRCRDRPNLELEVLPELQELLNTANACFKLKQSNVYAPSHYMCPILQEIMDDPYIAADGYTYEYRAIKAWLGKYKISPVTKLRLPHDCVIPNYSLSYALINLQIGGSFFIAIYSDQGSIFKPLILIFNFHV